MKTIYLVSCVAEKHTSELPAEELYCSDLFKKARAYVAHTIKREDTWFILSAKHGLLSPRTVIGPYNETLNNMGKAERIKWAQRVASELRKSLGPGDTVVFLAGWKYREFLQPAVLASGCQVSVPMEGMGIGKQLNWLDNAVRRSQARTK